MDRNTNKLDEHEDKVLGSVTEYEKLDNKSVLLRDRNYTGNTSSKRVQVFPPSNINQHLTENTTNRNGTQWHTSGHGISSNGSQYFSVKGEGRYLINNYSII
jgi:hypothetical protein